CRLSYQVPSDPVSRLRLSIWGAPLTPDPSPRKRGEGSKSPAQRDSTFLPRGDLVQAPREQRTSRRQRIGPACARPSSGTGLVMDDLPQPAGACPAAGPRLLDAAAETPAGFVPLRLVLQPGGLCVEVNRPDMLVGRHSTADVRLSLPDISRRHCRFIFADGTWRVVDLSSFNA